jgi:Zn-dependent protease
MAMRRNLSSAAEIRDIIIADAVLTLAFTLVLSGGLGAKNLLSNFEYVLPMAALGVSLSFVLHELMHKFVAQHYGAMAEFRTSPFGLAITLVTGFLGFLIGIPGATYIYSQSFTKRQNGIVSLAGPATNLAIFLVFLIVRLSLPASSTSYLASAASFVIFISLLLAFFNMLPIFPLDGSKVLAWNWKIYLVLMVAIFLLLVVFASAIISIYSILFMLVIAAFFSLMYRRVL